MTVLLIFVISSIFLKPIFLLVICEKSYNQNTSQTATSKIFLADAKKYLLIAETCWMFRPIKICSILHMIFTIVQHYYHRTESDTFSTSVLQKNTKDNKIQTKQILNLSKLKPHNFIYAWISMIIELNYGPYRSYLELKNVFRTQSNIYEESFAKIVLL